MPVCGAGDGGVVDGGGAATRGHRLRPHFRLSPCRLTRRQRCDPNLLSSLGLFNGYVLIEGVHAVPEGHELPVLRGSDRGGGGGGVRTPQTHRP